MFNGGDAGAFGNDVGVANLEGGRSGAVQMVIDGLTVAADGANVMRSRAVSSTRRCPAMQTI